MLQNLKKKALLYLHFQELAVSQDDRECARCVLDVTRIRQIQRLLKR